MLFIALVFIVISSFPCGTEASIAPRGVFSIAYTKLKECFGFGDGERVLASFIGTMVWARVGLQDDLVGGRYLSGVS